MYETFFGLTGKPFQLNPDPRFFYHSVGHKRALAYMRYGLQQEQGFIVVTGDVGTGKTMLVNNLFREIEDQAVVAAKIVSTNVKDIDLLRLIAAEFDVPFERSSKASLLHQLEACFKALRDEGKRVLLVIDEVQNLPRSALEELRMLSNFDYQGMPLVQSFLLGQREFRGIMRAPGLEQLRQRVIAAYHLKPLTEVEVKSYIEHRMRKVGWNDDPSIEDSAYQRIFEVTGGVPRRINTLFDRVLLNCYLDESHAITRQLVDTVFSEVDMEQGEHADDPVEVRETVPEAIGEGHASADEVQMLKERLRTMQATIETLSEQLAQTQPQSQVETEPLIQPRSGFRTPTEAEPRPPEQIRPVSAVAPSSSFDVTGQFEAKAARFPFWTTAVIVLLAMFTVAGIGLGLWALKG